MKDGVCGPKVSSLREIADIQYGLTAKANSEPVGPKFLRITDIQDGEVDWNTVPYCAPDPKKAAKCQVKKGDILFARTGATTGKSYLIADDVEAVFASYLIRVALKSNDAMPEYLALFFQTDEYWERIALGTEGAAQGGFNASKLGALEIPLPPLEEQKRIVAKLDQAFTALDRARAHAEANLADAGELFVSFLDDQLAIGNADWPRHKLEDLGKIQTGGTPKKADTQSYGDFIPFIKPGDFRPDGSLVLDNDGLSKTGAKKARIIPAGSALMVCIGATIGKAGFTEVDITSNQQVNAISPAEGISGNFLYYQFISPAFQKEVWKRSGQATLPIINKSKWSEIEVSVPADIETQNEVVEKLREMRRHVETLMDEYQTDLTDLADLRQSLLHKAFSGQL